MTWMADSAPTGFGSGLQHDGAASEKYYEIHYCVQVQNRV
jgi:hypothetical protein